jgi:RpiB/LacA/LacB family sugar-phosphate isomerase
VERIYICSDHISLFLKTAVVAFLQQRGIEVEDFGPFSEETVVDYNDYAQKVAKAVAASNGDRGIVICGTGLGASIAANKVRSVRAALCHDVYTAHQSRAHNDANILAMGAWIVSPQRMPGIVDEWLQTPFEGGRHIARVNVLDRFMSDETIKNNISFDPNVFQYAVALSTRKTVFGPVLYSGRIEEGFAALHSAGFRNVELSLRFADDLSFEELQSLLVKYTLKVTALATGQGCLHDQLCLSATDPDVHREAVKRLEDIIDLAHRLNTAVILGGVRGKFTGSEVDYPTQRAKVLEGVQQCCAYAQTQGVPLLLEAINRYETNFINTAAEAVAFIDEVGASNLKVLLDTFHMNIEEVDFHTAFRLTGEKLGYVHFVDSNRQAPGQGHTNLAAILKTLHDIGYRGVVSAEILPLIDDKNAVQRTANYLNSIGVNLKST